MPVAFLGDSGAGKSSIAAALATKGATLVSDDITPLQVGQASIVALQMRPELKLSSHMVKSDLSRYLPKTSYSVEHGKYRVPLDDGPGANRSSIRYPLTSLFVLDRQPRFDKAHIELEELRGHASCVALTRYSYLLPLVVPLRLQPRRLEQIARLSSRVKLRRLRYGSDLNRIGGVCDALIKQAEV